MQETFYTTQKENVPAIFAAAIFLVLGSIFVAYYKLFFIPLVSLPIVIILTFYGLYVPRVVILDKSSIQIKSISTFKHYYYDNILKIVIDENNPVGPNAGLHSVFLMAMPSRNKFSVKLLFKGGKRIGLSFFRDDTISIIDYMRKSESKIKIDVNDQLGLLETK